MLDDLIEEGKQLALRLRRDLADDSRDWERYETLASPVFAELAIWLKLKAEGKVPPATADYAAKQGLRFWTVRDLVSRLLADWAEENLALLESGDHPAITPPHPQN